jgi:hypothetical protein
MLPCTKPLLFFSRRSRHDLQIWNVQPGQRNMVSLLRLSHSVHLAVCTLMTVMWAGSEEQVLMLPPGVCAAGLSRDLPGVWDMVGVYEPLEEVEGIEALGVAGGTMGMDAASIGWADWGDGVFVGEDIVSSLSVAIWPSVDEGVEIGRGYV